MLRFRGIAAAGAAAALVAGLAAPLAWSIDTVATAHTGSLPTAGPAVQGGRGGFGGGMPGGGTRGGFGQQNGQGGPGGQQGGFGGQQGGFGQGGPGGQQGQGTQGGFGGRGGTGTQGGTGTGTRGGFGGGGAGGLLGGSVDVDSALVTALQTDASSYTWAAAAVGSQNAANYQLASGEAVMPIGGFNGSDPSPTLAEFKQYVAEGRIHYFIASGGTGRSNGGSSASSEIASWVESSFTSSTVGGVTVYDLSGAASGASA